MDSHLEVMSDLDVGSTFSFTVTVPTYVSGPPPAVPIDGSILIVCDNPIRRRLLRRQLTHFGVSTDTVPSADEVITRARTNIYAIALLDHALPNGPDTLDDQFAKIHHLQVIGLTAGPGNPSRITTLSTRAE